MSQEEVLMQEIIGKLNIAPDKIQVIRPRRLSCEVEYDNFSRAFDLLVKDFKFTILCSLTGLDEGEKLVAVYHLGQENGTVLNLKTSVDKIKPLIKSVTPYFPSAEVYEREIEDLLGFEVEGLTPGNRYPLTDDWPKGEFPLRKDWKPKV